VLAQRRQWEASSNKSDAFIVALQMRCRPPRRRANAPPVEPHLRASGETAMRGR
jgi:hypothetical protein